MHPEPQLYTSPCAVSSMLQGPASEPFVSIFTCTETTWVAGSPHNSARCDHSVAMQEPVPKMCHMVRNTFQPYVFGTFLANSGVI